MRRVAQGILAALVPLTVVGCEQATDPNPPEASPLSFAIVSGNNQSGPGGEMLPEPLVLRVTGKHHQLLTGVVITFHPVEGLGTVFSGAGVTNKHGIVQERWILGCAPPGEIQRVEARAVDNDTGDPRVHATFVASASTTGTPVGLEFRVSDPSGPAGGLLPEAFVAPIDRCGNPVRGVAVQLDVAAGGGTVAPASVNTDDSGLAPFSWTLGTHGGDPQILTATTGEFLASLEVSLFVPAEATLEKVSGDGQSGPVGADLPEPLVVSLALPDGQPLVGFAVVWTFDSSGVVVGVMESPTDESGRASTIWRLYSAPGTYMTTATVPGLPPVAFTATATSTAATRSR